MIYDGDIEKYAELQECIDTVESEGGDTIELPPGELHADLIQLGHRVKLKGSGMRSTFLIQNAGASGHFITNKVAVDKTGRNAQYCGLSSLTVRGNKDGVNLNHGIFFNQFPSVARADNDESFDPHYLLEDLYVENFGATGVWVQGRSESRLSNITAHRNAQYGLRLPWDSMNDKLTASYNGLDGIFVNETNVSISNSKTFLNGQIKPSAGLNISFTTGVVVNGFMAQDNLGPGVRLNNAKGASIMGLLVDSNSFGLKGASPGVDMWQTTGCQIVGVSTDRNNGGNGVWQMNALRHRGGSTKNFVRMSHYANKAADVLGPGLTTDSVVAESDIVIF